MLPRHMVHDVRTSESLQFNLMLFVQCMPVLRDMAATSSSRQVRCQMLKCYNVTLVASLPFFLVFVVPVAVCCLVIILPLLPLPRLPRIMLCCCDVMQLCSYIATDEATGVCAGYCPAVLCSATLLTRSIHQPSGQTLQLADALTRSPVIFLVQLRQRHCLISLRRILAACRPADRRQQAYIAPPQVT